MPDADAAQPEPLHPDKLTWAVLLGRWIEFARGAVAMPDDDAAGRRMRDSVADVIMLQAVWFALQHLDELDSPAERALGLDRAEVLIDKHAGVLTDRWSDAMPATMTELIADARRALQAAQEKDGMGQRAPE